MVDLFMVNAGRYAIHGCSMGMDDVCLGLSHRRAKDWLGQRLCHQRVRKKKLRTVDLLCHVMGGDWVLVLLLSSWFSRKWLHLYLKGNYYWRDLFLTEP